MWSQFKTAIRYLAVLLISLPCGARCGDWLQQPPNRLAAAPGPSHRLSCYFWLKDFVWVRVSVRGHHLREQISLKKVWECSGVRLEVHTRPISRLREQGISNFCWKWPVHVPAISHVSAYFTKQSVHHVMKLLRISRTISHYWCGWSPLEWSKQVLVSCTIFSLSPVQ